MNRKKSLVVFGIIIVLIILITCMIYPQRRNKLIIILDKENSYFHSFEVKDGKVYMYSEISLENTSNKQVRFKIFANSYEDEKNALLSDKRMEGYEWVIDEDSRKAKITNNNIFSLKGKEKITGLKIVFVGKHGGKNVKQDRNLPDIDIVVDEELK